jgi:hypothetical protein
MTLNKIPNVPTLTLYDSFDDHLSDNFNERVLFSAPFGSGKTTFLKAYFDQHQEYLVLKLFPVNYAIAQSQDVFELIKYDLLYELLSKYPDEIQLDHEQYSWLLISQMYLLHQMKIEQPLKLLLKAAKAFSGTAPIPEEETIDMVTSIFGDLSDYKAKLSASEFDNLSSFVKSFKNKKGHIHESDHITELIVDLLIRVQQIKAEHQKTDDREISVEECETILPKSILLIDDLDRLDPEHVFRLFNIFSAHYDDVNETNKFGFDKVIFVCDVNNIQQMFAHRYGISVEFNGYIDKFYSSEIFHFDITRYLKESITTLLNARTELLKFFPEKNSIDNSFIERYQLTKHDSFSEILEYVLSEMIDHGQIKIRNFQRFRLYAIPNQKAKFKSLEFQVVFYPLLVLISNLSRFFARSIDLENALEVAFKSYPSNYSELQPGKRSELDTVSQNLIQICLPFLIDPEKTFNCDFERDKLYTIAFKNEQEREIFISFSMSENFRYRYAVVTHIRFTGSGVLVEGRNENPSLVHPNPFWFLYLAYKNVKKNKFI